MFCVSNYIVSSTSSPKKGKAHIIDAASSFLIRGFIQIPPLEKCFPHVIDVCLIANKYVYYKHVFVLPKIITYPIKVPFTLIDN